jgi:TPR repeat protein
MKTRTIGMVTAAVLFASMVGFETLLPPLQAQTASAGNPEIATAPSNRTAKEEPTGSIGVVFPTPTAASSVSKLVVKNVVDDGPAANAGIKSGDEIQTLDGNTVTSVDQLTDVLSKHPVGSSVKVEYLRAGQHFQCVVAVVERKRLYRNWYAKQADRGEPEGEYSLGMTYYLGYGTAKDYTQAAQWFTKAAEQGNAPAQYYLADLYYEGRGVGRNYAVAMQWFRKSAEQGYAQAQAAVGLMYEDGSAGASDFGEAMAWYQKAAQQGWAPAQFFIGNLYAQGRGVQKDLQQARLWYGKAIEAGNADAKKALAALEHPSNRAEGLAQQQASMDAYFAKQRAQQAAADAAATTYEGCCRTTIQAVDYCKRWAAGWNKESPAWEGWTERSFQTSVNVDSSSTRQADFTNYCPKVLIDHYEFEQSLKVPNWCFGQPESKYKSLDEQRSWVRNHECDPIKHTVTSEEKALAEMATAKDNEFFPKRCQDNDPRPLALRNSDPLCIQQAQAAVEAKRLEEERKKAEVAEAKKEAQAKAEEQQARAAFRAAPLPDQNIKPITVVVEKTYLNTNIASGSPLGLWAEVRISSEDAKRLHDPVGVPKNLAWHLVPELADGRLRFAIICNPNGQDCYKLNPGKTYTLELMNQYDSAGARGNLDKRFVRVNGVGVYMVADYGGADN